MTKKQALRLFRQEIMPELKKQHPKDTAAYRTSWNDYTDGLHNDGLITEHQLNTWNNPY